MGLILNIKTNEYGIFVLSIKFKNKEEIECSIGDFFKLPKDYDEHNSGLFTLINKYFSTLPEGVNEEIYNTYARLNEEGNYPSYSNIENTLLLESEVIRISSLLNYNEFKIWFKANDKSIIYPDTLNDVFIYDPDMNTTEEKTYIKEEYKDLIAMILFIRALSPLYIQFFNYIKNITPHYYYKLFMLFMKTDITQSKELRKLERYIDTNQITLTGNANNKTGDHVLNTGLSDDDITYNLISIVIFNKLMSVDFTTKECNAVSYIFQTIRYKSNFTSADNLAIRSKKTTGDPNKEDISYFEDYRKTSVMPIGTIVELQHALSDMDFIIDRLGLGNFDRELYKEELKYVNSFSKNRIDKIQIYLLGWFISKIINPRALYYIEYKRLIELLIFSKVVLINNDQKFIAALMSSYKTDEPGYVTVVIRNSINKTLISKLTKNYSFVLSDSKQTIIEKTITEISKEITGKIWRPIGELKYLEDHITNGYLNIPNNLNSILIDYIEFVN